MANVSLSWKEVAFNAKEVTGWISFATKTQLNERKILLSDRAVYVIRVMRPYSFWYGQKNSPVAYIGKGKAQQRLTSHLKIWIPELAKKFPI